MSPPPQERRVDDAEVQDAGYSADVSNMDVTDSSNPEEDHSLVIMSDDAGQVYAPPAHIAARFYRNKIVRRKSSADCSRRNSLSSVNSHASSRSHRRSSGAQSNYIAHHLRRASIIESRKARFADREAHAEQVRLRAALAKATPRGSISKSEEKALAAQLAKEKYLAKVTAQCAEEVAKAKRIAEEVKERKLEEERRQRFEMEERLAEADKRRAEYQRNMAARRMRRASSSEKKLAVVQEDIDADEEAIIDSPEPPVLDEETAANRIQRTWRTHLRKGVLRAFKSLYICADRVEQHSFEEMTALVADQQIISATTKMLQSLGLETQDETAAALGARTFLSAYLISGHPISVLSRNGAQEQDLITKVKDLVVNFEAVVGRLAEWNNYKPNPTRLESLSQAYTSYTSAFAAWRLQDSSVLIEGMVAQFVELDAIWQTVKDDSRGEVANDYREGIRDNQVMLLSRIRKLAGPDRADFLIKKAIRESRRRRPKRRAAAEVRPRGIESPPGTEATAAPESAATQVETAVSAEQDGSSTSGELRRLFTAMPSNRILTHELAIDKDYKLDDTANSELRDQLYRTVCESMRQAFEAGQGALWTVSAAENIREKLLRMLKPGNSMYKLISETLESANVARQCQQGVFSYEKFFDFMANVLPKLCAPFRDAEVKALAEELGASSDDISVMIEKLFKLLRVVDFLSLDYSNFMIMGAAPRVIEESAGYEQRMFAKDLEDGVITLQRTKRWWRNASVNLITEAERRDPENIRLADDRPNGLKIYARGLLDLAVAQGDLQDLDVPETLQLDHDRIARMRAQAIRITTVGAILLTAKNLLKRDVRSQWKAESSRLWELLSKEGYSGSDDLSVADKVLGALESAHNMPQVTKAHLQGTIARSLGQAAMGRFTDPTLKVLFQRLKSHVFSRISAVSATERVRAASNASTALASVGLTEFAPHVGGIVDTLARISEVDWKSHGLWYQQVAKELQEAGDEDL